MDVHTDPSCGRATDPDTALSSNPGLDIIWPQVGAPATHISLFLIAGASSVLLPSTGCERSASPSLPFLNHIPAHLSGNSLTGPASSSNLTLFLLVSPPSGPSFRSLIYNTSPPFALKNFFFCFAFVQEKFPFSHRKTIS